METDGHVLQVIGSELGLDNQGFDLPSDWEDILGKGDIDGCRQSDTYAPLGQTNFGTTYTPHDLGLDQGQSSQGHRHLNGVSDQLVGQPHHHQLQQQQQQQQQQQYQQNLQQQHRRQQQQQQQQQQQHHSAHINPAYEHPCHHAQQHQQHQHQQQQHHHHQQQPTSHCSLTGQPQIPYEGYDQTALNHTCLPESPPDSCSEPYSPDGNIQSAMTDLKGNIPGSLPSIPQSMYLGHTPRGAPMPQTKGSPYVGGEPPKPPIHPHHSLAHHPGHPASMQGQIQQQQQQQSARVPYPPSGVGMGTPLPHQMSPLGHPVLPAHMGSLSSMPVQPSKKRKYSDSLPGGMGPADMIHGMNGVLIKQEPPGIPPGVQFSYINDCSADEDPGSYDLNSSDSYQVVKWKEYKPNPWAVLADADLKDLPAPYYKVEADKGFKFMPTDDAFVCQKKNHFQVTVHIRLSGHAKYVRTSGGMKKIDCFRLHLYGIKLESENQKVRIEHSRSDRTKEPFQPERVDLSPENEFSNKVTIARLHFSETTMNNMRKKCRPNPEQRYFLLVVSLHAHSGDSNYMVVGSMSDRIIVRASNPGQFENEADALWQKGQTRESVYHVGKVGVNTDHPDEAFTVHGNMLLTGVLKQPSDMRVKENIQQMDSRIQLENVSKLKIVRHTYNETFADHVGIPPEHREGVGVLAQDVQLIWPDAVQETGDIVLPNGKTIHNFKVVNKERIFIETVGATQELSKLTSNLGNRMKQLERMTRMNKLKRGDSTKSDASSWSSISGSTTYSTSSSISVPTPKPEKKHTSSRSTSRENKSDKSGNSKSRSHSSHESRRHHRKEPKPDEVIEQEKASACSGAAKKCLGRKTIYLMILLLVCILMVSATTAIILYTLDKTNNADRSSYQNSLEGQQNNNNNNNNNHNNNNSRPPSVTTEHPGTGAPTPTPAQHRETQSGSHGQGTSSHLPVSTLAPTTSTSTTQRPAGQRPIVPPYPPCPTSYCESKCCPAPDQDSPTVINHGDDVGYNNGEGGRWGEQTNDIESTTRSKSTTELNHNIIIDIPMNSSQYNVISNNNNGDNTINGGPQYSVITHTNDANYRRKRSSGEPARPVIRIVELDYTLDDRFCLQDGCIGGHSYSYFIPLNSAFGYDPVTIELRTEEVSLMVHCQTTFLWTCPTDSITNEVTGNHQQLTSTARWRLQLATSFQTTLNFKVIFSLKGNRSETPPCHQENNDDFLVMTYNLKFQRTC